ncbi:PucR family transcriptional regulator [Amycolatopsis dongchuanensis]|uniref:Helix-turn-helix domain-containing protein n=1 Tax=Amycolatopsis dongchuanensis TaxID=1070866 RepID=A0ABP9R812_9PSEU
MTEDADDEIQDAEVASIVAIASRLRSRVPALVRHMIERMSEEIPELGVDERLTPLLNASVESNVETVLHLLQHGMALDGFETPWAAGEYARRLAQHDVPLVALIRAYRLGQDSLVRLLIEEVHREGFDATRTSAITSRIVTFSFDYIDLMSQRVAVVYEEERESWLRNRSTARAARIRELLAGRSVNRSVVEGVLGYRLRQQHLGIVVWIDDVARREFELANLDRLIVTIAERLGCVARPLTVPCDEASSWAWLPFAEGARVDHDIIENTLKEWDFPARVALGEIESDLEGFRTTHWQATQAQTVAVTAGQRAPLVSRFAQVGTVALLCADLKHTRAWLTHVLGPLAADDEQHARLRETLRVFLAGGGSYTAAAAALNLHKNSVKYRVLKAEEVRGRPINGDRVDVEMALTACRWLGSAVLSGTERPPRFCS